MERHRNVRKSTAYILATSVNVVLFALLMLHAWQKQGGAELALKPCTEAVKQLQLTDLCLFTEARYTRNPSLADINSPFQDHPLALEHFPAGSLVTPPSFHSEAP